MVDLPDIADQLSDMINHQRFDQQNLLTLAETLIVGYSDNPSGDMLQVIICLIRASMINDWTIHIMDALYHIRSITHDIHKRTCVHYPRYKTFADISVSSTGFSP